MPPLSFGCGKIRTHFCVVLDGAIGVLFFSTWYPCVIANRLETMEKWLKCEDHYTGWDPLRILILVIPQLFCITLGKASYEFWDTTTVRQMNAHSWMNVPPLPDMEPSCPKSWCRMQPFKEGYNVRGLVASNYLKEMMRLDPSWCMHIALEEELNKIITETDADVVDKMHWSPIFLE